MNGCEITPPSVLFRRAYTSGSYKLLQTFLSDEVVTQHLLTKDDYIAFIEHAVLNPNQWPIGHLVSLGFGGVKKIQEAHELTNNSNADTLYVSDDVVAGEQLGINVSKGIKSFFKPNTDKKKKDIINCALKALVKHDLMPIEVRIAPIQITEELDNTAPVTSITPSSRRRDNASQSDGSETRSIRRGSVLILYLCNETSPTAELFRATTATPRYPEAPVISPRGGVASCLDRMLASGSRPRGPLFGWISPGSPIDRSPKRQRDCELGSLSPITAYERQVRSPKPKS